MATASLSTTTTINSVDGLAKCAICLDFYNDPRCLPCSHTFCYTCLKTFCAEGSRQCPMRDGTIINSATIHLLPVNRVAKDLVEHIRNTSDSESVSSSVNKCDHCKKILSEFMCETCSKHYCTICLKLEHDINQFDTHKINIAIEKGSTGICRQHVGEKQKYWCDRCATAVCSDCLLFEHKDHPFTTIDKMSQKIKDEYHSSAQTLLLAKENLENLSKNTKEAKRNQSKTHIKTMDLIKQTINQLQKLLEERKIHLIETFRKQDIIQRCIFQTQEKNIEEELKLVLIRILFTKQLINGNNQFQLIKMRTDVLNYNALIEEQCKLLMHGFTFELLNFSIDDNLSKLKHELDFLGTLSTDAFLVNNTNVCPLLKLSELSGEETYQNFQGNYAYGYRFHLSVPLTCQTLLVKVALFNRTLTVFILDNDDFVVKKETVTINDNNSKEFKWIIFPLNFQLQQNYYIFLWARPNGNFMPSIACRESNHNLRQINENISVRSKRAKINQLINIDIKSKLDVVYDALLSRDERDETIPAVEMILNV